MTKEFYSITAAANMLKLFDLFGKKPGRKGLQEF